MRAIDYINKKLSNFKYKKLSIVLIINIIIFVSINVICQLKYDEMDDFVMMTLLSGVDGTYSPYCIFIHPFVSTIIMLLFKTSININWYTVVLLFVQFISFTLIGVVFLKRMKTKLGTMMYLLFAMIFYCKLLLNIQFTTVSAVALLAGLLSIIYYIENLQILKERKFLYLGLFFIALGTMIRVSTAIFIIPFISLYIVYNIMHTKNIKNIKYILIIILVIGAVYISNMLIYTLNDVYKNHLEFNSARAALNDFIQLEYKDNEELFKSVNWNENDVYLFYSYTIADNPVCSTETLNEIAKRKT